MSLPKSKKWIKKYLFRQQYLDLFESRGVIASRCSKFKQSAMLFVARSAKR